MSDKLIPPAVGEDITPSKSWKSYFSGLINPLWLSLFMGVLLTFSIILYYSPWKTGFSKDQDIVALKEETRILNERLAHMEETEKAAPQSDNNSTQLTALEQQVGQLLQQMESLKNPQVSEESSKQMEYSKAFEKDLHALATAQETLRAALLFWNLRTKILSNGPYAEELAAFKAVTKEAEDLSLLEKYKESGLQPLKESPESSVTMDKQSSWWARLKTTFQSLIKIEKIDTSTVALPIYSEDHQAIEDLLAHLDLSYIQNLSTLPVSPTPQPGDTL